MFSQREIDARTGAPASTVRLFAERLGLAPKHERGQRVYSVGDAIRVRMAMILSRRGYTAVAACHLVIAMDSELSRLALEEEAGARAWLFWRMKTDEPDVAEYDIIRDGRDAFRAAMDDDSGTLIPIAPLLKQAMASLIEEPADA